VPRYATRAGVEKTAYSVDLQGVAISEGRAQAADVTFDEVFSDWRVKQGGLQAHPARAELTLDAFPARRLTGRVVDVGSAGERREQWGREPYFLVRIEMNELDVEIMKPGMSVRCVIDTTEPSKLADAGGR